MSSTQIREMETYLRRLGEVFNVVYKRLTDLEGRVSNLENEISRLKAETGMIASKVDDLKVSSVSRAEFEDLVNRLTTSLKELVPESPKEGSQ